MILLRHLKEAIRLDRSKDMSTHVSNSHQLRFQSINDNCVEVVALIRRVCFYVSFQKMGDLFLEKRINTKFCARLSLEMKARDAVCNENSRHPHRTTDLARRYHK